MANYKDYGYNLARQFSEFFRREWEVKISSFNLKYAWQVI